MIIRGLFNFGKMDIVADLSTGSSLILIREYLVTEDTFRVNKLLADHDDAVAMVAVGFFYHKGLGGVCKNQCEAYKYYRAAAELGNSSGIYSLAHFYFHGIYIPENKILAFQLYMMAADKNHPCALYSVGVCYYHGYGIDVNKDESYEYIVRSAENGNSKALLCLQGFER